MDRCTSCQNILPRTVDRCPVCGHDNIPAAVEELEVPRALQSRDFLGSIGSKPERVRNGASISSPRSRRAPTRVGHDGATPLYESKTTTPERTSDFELPSPETETRSVTAMSTRLNSNIRLGRKRSHNIVVGGVSLVAVATLLSGSFVGYQRSEVPDQIAMASLSIPTRPGDLPLQVSELVEGFDPAAIVKVLETAACGAPVNTHGVVVEGGTILGALTLTQNAGTPSISTGDITTSADVLGLAPTNDLTVLRPVDRLEARLRIATSTNVRKGTRLALVSIGPIGITLSPAVVTEFQTRDGAVHNFAIGTEFEEDVDTPTQSFDRGTIVLDASGALLGMAGNDGNFVTANRIAQSVARFQSEPDFPNPVCG